MAQRKLPHPEQAKRVEGRTTADPTPHSTFASITSLKSGLPASVNEICS